MSPEIEPDELHCRFAVIERTALNVSLFTNASDYSNKTCMDRCMCLYLTNMVDLVSLEYVVTAFGDNDIQCSAFTYS